MKILSKRQMKRLAKKLVKLHDIDLVAVRMIIEKECIDRTKRLTTKVVEALNNVVIDLVEQRTPEAKDTWNTYAPEQKAQVLEIYMKVKKNG